MDMLSVLEEAVLAHVGQKAEVKVMVGPFPVEKFLFLSKDSLVVWPRQVQSSMDEMSGRSEHCFTGQ